MRWILTGLLAITMCMSSMADDALRVLTYNIHHAEGMDGILDVERIAQVIEETHPDVVCLQEVDRGMDRTKGLDIAADLAKRLNMSYAFGPNLAIQGGEYGNATLSAFPITHDENLRLPNVPKGEQRGALRTAIEWKGRTVTVWNTHFDLTEDARKKQAAALAERIDSTQTIVCGDLNETDDRPGVSLLLNQLEDTARLAGKAIEGTIGSRDARRIDYVLVSRDLGATEWQVIRTDKAKIASDHAPVLTVITFPALPVDAADRGIHAPEDERIEEAVQEGADHE